LGTCSPIVMCATVEVGDRGFAEEADAQRRERDAELARRQVAPDVVQLPQDQRRPGIRRVEPAAPGADQRELRGHEEPVREDEQHHPGQQHEGHSDRS
jgi:hypothetical protein